MRYILFQTKGVGVDAEDDEDGNQPKSPAGLTLTGVYKRLKMETQGLDDGIVGLESKDAEYGVSATPCGLT